MSTTDQSHTPTRRRRRKSRRSRSRSASPHSRRRSGSYSDRTYSDYSDSFYTDDESDRGKRGGGKYGGTGSRGGQKGNRGRGKQGGRMSRAPPSPRGVDYVTKRMLSARRMKINELKSEVEDLSSQLTESKKENKTLVRHHRIHERQLDRYEGQENEMPSIIQRHSEEVRALQEQLRRQKEKYKKNSKKFKDSEDELERTRRLLKKMKGLVDDKDLKERDDLSQKLSKCETDLEESSNKVKQLERHIENLNKNHRHELGIERARQKETVQTLQDVQTENKRLQMALREKEKELEISNIYQHRLMKPPHKLNSSVSSSPLPEPRRLPYVKRRKSSTPGETPRDRAKRYERSRHDEEQRHKEDTYDEYDEAQERRQRENNMEQEIQLRRQRENANQREAETRRKQEERQDEDDQHLQEQREEEERRLKEERERLKRESEDLEARQRKVEQENKRQENIAQKERENRERQEMERRERDEREHREREEQEVEERESRERREREERERREREEQERRADDERKRLTNNKAEQERRRQKELLLAKMKAIDDANKLDNDPFVPQGSAKKEYRHTEPIKNMHHGKPAYDNVTVPVLEKNKKKNPFFLDSDEEVGYQPTFNGTSGSASKQKKKNFLDDSNGSPQNRKSNKPQNPQLIDDLFGKDTQKGKNKDNHSSIDDEAPPKSNSHLLPRRTRQPNTTTISSKPTVNAIDSFDDDIEEVVL